MRHACMCVGPVCKAPIFSLLPHCQEETNSQQKPTTNIKQPTKTTANKNQKKKGPHFQCLSLFFAVSYFIFIKLNVFFWKPMCFLSKRFKKIKQKIQKNPPSRQPVKTRDGRRTGRARAGLSSRGPGLSCRGRPWRSNMFCILTPSHGGP